jgi:hypothetical protein
MINTAIDAPADCLGSLMLYITVVVRTTGHRFRDLNMEIVLMRITISDKLNCYLARSGCILYASDVSSL